MVFCKPSTVSSYNARNITLPYTFSTKILWCGKCIESTNEWTSTENSSHRYMHALYSVVIVDTSTVQIGRFGYPIIAIGY